MLAEHGVVLSNLPLPYPPPSLSLLNRVKMCLMYVCACVYVSGAAMQHFPQQTSKEIRTLIGNFLKRMMTT